MPSNLTPHEKAFLQDLKTYPEWQTILDKIVERRTVSRYRPEGDLDESVKIHRWILQSGRSRENEEIVKFLTLEL